MTTATQPKTLAEVRRQHKAHCGYIWDCPHCKEAYIEAVRLEAEKLEKAAA